MGSVFHCPSNGLAWGQVVGARRSPEANLGEWMWARGEATRVVGTLRQEAVTVCKCVLGPSVYEVIRWSHLLLQDGTCRATVVLGLPLFTPWRLKDRWTSQEAAGTRILESCGGVRGSTEGQGVPHLHTRKAQEAPCGIRDSSLGSLGKGEIA